MSQTISQTNNGPRKPHKKDKPTASFEDIFGILTVLQCLHPGVGTKLNANRDELKNVRCMEISLMLNIMLRRNRKCTKNVFSQIIANSASTFVGYYSQNRTYMGSLYPYTADYCSDASFIGVKHLQMKRFT